MPCDVNTLSCLTAMAIFDHRPVLIYSEDGYTQLHPADRDLGGIAIAIWLSAG